MVEKFTFEEWKQLGTKLFGESMKKWKFVCVNCGNIQSIESILEHNSNLDENNLKNSVYYSCEGRLAEKIGCDWSLGGLFKTHKSEVIHPDGAIIPVFEYYQKVEGQKSE